jgi:tRNA (guanine-N(7)-)-methyltransferase
MLLYPAQLFADSDFLASGWAHWLPGSGPLNLEIGCGYGHFLTAMATRFPQQRFIGLDIISHILGQVSRRLAREGLTNACVCKLDAVLALRELFPAGSVDNLYILFPDPWFKERRLKRRILRTETLPELLRVLKPGGHFYFVTDDSDYARDAHDLLENCAQLSRQPFPDLELNTKYERKWLLQDKTIHRFCYRLQTALFIPESWPGYSGQPEYLLPNWGAKDNRYCWEQFTPQQILTAGDILKLTACYWSEPDQALLLRCLLAAQGALALPFWLELNAGCLQVPTGSFIPRLRQRENILEQVAALLQQGQGAP